MVCVKHVAIIWLLLSAQLVASVAEAALQTVNRGRALRLAIWCREPDVVKTLLDESVHDINTRNALGTTPLMIAAMEGHTAIVVSLIARGALVNMCDEEGDTALILAALFGHTDAALALISAGARVNVRGKDGDTALMHAAFYGNVALVRALLEAGADYSLKNHAGQTALMIAKLKKNRAGRSDTKALLRAARAARRQRLLQLTLA